MFELYMCYAIIREKSEFGYGRLIQSIFGVLVEGEGDVEQKRLFSGNLFMVGEVFTDNFPSD